MWHSTKVDNLSMKFASENESVINKNCYAESDIWVDYKWKVYNHWSKNSFQELRAIQQIDSLTNVVRDKY